jgi:cytochrome b561
LTPEDKPSRWGGLIISLHWAGAAIILALIALGWAMVYGGFGSASTFDLYQWHKSFGFVALALTAARLAARFAGLRLPLPRGGSDGFPHSPKAHSTS